MKESCVCGAPTLVGAAHVTSPLFLFLRTGDPMTLFPLATLITLTLAPRHASAFSTNATTSRRLASASSSADDGFCSHGIRSARAKNGRHPCCGAGCGSCGESESGCTKREGGTLQCKCYKKACNSSIMATSASIAFLGLRYVLDSAMRTACVSMA